MWKVIYSGTSLESFGRRPRFRGSFATSGEAIAPLPFVTVDAVVGFISAPSLSLLSDIVLFSLSLSWSLSLVT